MGYFHLGSKKEVRYKKLDQSPGWFPLQLVFMEVRCERGPASRRLSCSMLPVESLEIYYSCSAVKHENPQNEIAFKCVGTAC